MKASLETLETVPCVLFSTCPTIECARHIAETLIINKLAAGVNLVPHMQSIYWWQGEVKNHEEVWLIVKTQSCHFTEIQELFAKLHPYQVPELIMLPITQGLPSYLAWLEEICASKSERSAL